jgi:ankyrin repeat protein
MKKQLTGLRGDSHLHSAIRVGNSELVLEIISENQGEEELKELFSKQNNSGETALYIAAENGHLDIVKELIKYHDVGLASLKARNGFDAFHVAAKNGNLGMFVKFKCIQCLGVGLGSLLYIVFMVLDLLQLR